MTVDLDRKLPCNYDSFRNEASLRRRRGTDFVVQVDHVKVCLEFVAESVFGEVNRINSIGGICRLRATAFA
jgi:hypothetical protein